jgi:hypothetical protein
LRSGTDPHTIATVVKTNTAVAEGLKFAEEVDDQLRKELMEEFNSLSILYGKPSVNFIAPEYQVKYVKMPEEHPLLPGEGGAAPIPPGAQSTAAAAPAPMSFGDVDLLGFGGPPSPVAPAPSAASGLSLDPSATMTGDEYQSKWGAIPDSEATVSTVPLQQLPSSTDKVEQALAAAGILTMASGELPNEFKFFLYALDTSSGALFLVQSNIEKTSEPLMIVTIKSSLDSGLNFSEKLVEAMTKALN